MPPLSSFVRRVISLVVLESDDPWASEVTFYSNGAVALGAFFGFFFALHLSSALSFSLALASFALLRFALSHRVTTLCAAVVTTLFLSSIAAALAWMIAQCADTPFVPEIAATVSAAAAAILPARAYYRFLKGRRAHAAESLVPSAR
jgi:hypothetical protein